MADDYYTPDSPPGYVFVTNSEAFDFATKRANTEARVLEGVAANFADIPLGAFLTLARPKPHIAFATFVEAVYAPTVAAWVSGIQDKLAVLKMISELEEREKRSNE